MNFVNRFRNWDDVKEYAAGSVIFSEQESADVMYVVLSGEVELTLRGESLGVETKGGMLGEMAMISSSTRNATATAVRKSRLARLDQQQFKDVVAKDPEFSLQVMGVLANRLRAVDQFISKRLKKQA